MPSDGNQITVGNLAKRSDLLFCNLDNAPPVKRWWSSTIREPGVVSCEFQRTTFNPNRAGSNVHAGKSDPRKKPRTRSLLISRTKPGPELACAAPVPHGARNDQPSGTPSNEWRTCKAQGPSRLSSLKVKQQVYGATEQVENSCSVMQMGAPRIKSQTKCMRKSVTMDDRLLNHTSFEPQPDSVSSTLPAKRVGPDSTPSGLKPIPCRRTTSVQPPVDSPIVELDLRPTDRVWSDMWNSGMPFNRPWQPWGTYMIPLASRDQPFSKDTYTFHTLNVIGAGRYVGASFPAGSESVSMTSATASNAHNLNQPPVASTTWTVPDLQVKRLTLGDGKATTSEMAGRSKYAPDTSGLKSGLAQAVSGSSRNSELEMVTYMDPRVGASHEFLSRMNELVNLEEATKRWERMRSRRRLKKRSPTNGSMGSSFENSSMTL